MISEAFLDDFLRVLCLPVQQGMNRQDMLKERTAFHLWIIERMEASEVYSTDPLDHNVCGGQTSLSLMGSNQLCFRSIGWSGSWRTWWNAVGVHIRWQLLHASHRHLYKGQEQLYWINVGPLEINRIFHAPGRINQDTIRWVSTRLTKAHLSASFAKFLMH